MGNIEVRLGHSNIADIVLKKKSENTAAKKQKTLQKKKNKNPKHFLKAKKVFLLLKNLLVMQLKILNYQKQSIIEKNWCTIVTI